MYANVLGVRIDNVTKADALKRLSFFFNNGEQHSIFTPNPEMLVDACRDSRFRQVLNSGSLNICDGKGLQLASKTKLQRVPGADFMMDICEFAESEGRSVFLLGSRSDEVVGKTTQELLKRYPKLNVVGCNKGPVIHKNNETFVVVDSKENQKIIDEINKKRPDILFVAFGHVKQEIWIHENLAKMPSVRVAMGVGGAFDYISGKIRRAPCWMRIIGLEWIYRLIRQPKRIKRIFKAVTVFLFEVLIQNFKIKNQNDKSKF